MDNRDMDMAAKYQRRDQAARVVQASWKAYQQRKKFNRMRDAVLKIQAVAKGWHTRKKLLQQRNRQDQDERFQEVMSKHRQRIQVLEREKRLIQATPAADLDDWELKRYRAAAMVQAHWRGLVQRRKFAQSPERTKREQAAKRIQAAFKRIITARRSLDASSSYAGGSLSLAQSSASLRQSGASVLLGSPQMRSSTVGPHASSTAPTRDRDFMSAKRYKELENQVTGRVEAYRSLARHQRRDVRQLDDVLAPLLRQHNQGAQARIAATHVRQRSLVLTDTLCEQLSQMRTLAQLPEDLKPQDFPRPARGSERMERASQAHALQLAEAKVGSKWWVHLKGLNQQAMQDALLAEDAERWQAMDAKWRSSWAQLLASEQQRPDPLEEFQKAGPGAEAVAAARQQANLDAKAAEYAARASGTTTTGATYSPRVSGAAYLPHASGAMYSPSVTGARHSQVVTGPRQSQAVKFSVPL